MYQHKCDILSSKFSEYSSEEISNFVQKIIGGVGPDLKTPDSELLPSTRICRPADYGVFSSAMRGTISAPGPALVLDDAVLVILPDNNIRRLENEVSEQLLEELRHVQLNDDGTDDMGDNSDLIKRAVARNVNEKKKYTLCKAVARLNREKGHTFKEALCKEITKVLADECENNTNVQQQKDEYKDGQKDVDDKKNEGGGDLGDSPLVVAEKLGLISPMKTDRKHTYKHTHIHTPRRIECVNAERTNKALEQLRNNAGIRMVHNNELPSSPMQLRTPWYMPSRMWFSPSDGVNRQNRDSEETETWRLPYDRLKDADRDRTGKPKPGTVLANLVELRVAHEFRKHLISMGQREFPHYIQHLPTKTSGAKSSGGVVDYLNDNNGDSTDRGRTRKKNINKQSQQEEEEGGIGTDWNFQSNECVKYDTVHKINDFDDKL
eukprot:GHVR01138604.1.p1 GENE.GHVR01138604.1~~GHVR01138604.1.p1  ORF type:complete len:435 (+),score=110.48 GHVR01138604.1:166-1470(+)